MESLNTSFVSWIRKQVKLLFNLYLFSNDKNGFDFLIQKLKPYSKDSVFISMEDTGHYHFALLKFLLDKHFNIALINPKTIDQYSLFKEHKQLTYKNIYFNIFKLFHKKYVYFIWYAPILILISAISFNLCISERKKVFFLFHRKLTQSYMIQFITLIHLIVKYFNCILR